MLKKTEYFTGVISPTGTGISVNMRLDACIDEAKKKKDDFLEKNIANIAKIDTENIQTLSLSNNAVTHVIITLTYYPKK